jgi:hypothetical protein
MGHYALRQHVSLRHSETGTGTQVPSNGQKGISAFAEESVSSRAHAVKSFARKILRVTSTYREFCREGSTASPLFSLISSQSMGVYTPLEIRFASYSADRQPWR